MSKVIICKVECIGVLYSTSVLGSVLFNIFINDVEEKYKIISTEVEMRNKEQMVNSVGN